jgi:hypothetical protein
VRCDIESERKRVAAGRSDGHYDIIVREFVIFQCVLNGHGRIGGRIDEFDARPERIKVIL